VHKKLATRPAPQKGPHPPGRYLVSVRQLQELRGFKPHIMRGWTRGFGEPRKKKGDLKNGTRKAPGVCPITVFKIGKSVYFDLKEFDAWLETQGRAAR
jgi:hypothetical protein